MEEENAGHLKLTTFQPNTVITNRSTGTEDKFPLLANLYASYTTKAMHEGKNDLLHTRV